MAALPDAAQASAQRRTCRSEENDIIVFGIDPGVTGAIACLVNGEVHSVRDLPVRLEGTGTVKRKLDSAGLAAIVRDWRQQIGQDAEMAVIEKVASMPKQGVASVFSLGHSAGVCEAVMQALWCRVEFVAPRTWKTAVGCGADKATSAARASLLYPRAAGYWSTKSGHNRAEALLLAHWGWVLKC